MVNDLTTLNTYNLQPNPISSMQQTRLCVVNTKFCFGKKTSNFHKEQTLTATIDPKICLALWLIRRNCSKKETAFLFCSRFVKTLKRLNEYDKSLRIA